MISASHKSYLRLWIRIHLKEINQTYVVRILALGIKNTNIILYRNTWESTSQETQTKLLAMPFFQGTCSSEGVHLMPKRSPPNLFIAVAAGHEISQHLRCLANGVRWTPGWDRKVVELLG